MTCFPRSEKKEFPSITTHAMFKRLQRIGIKLGQSSIVGRVTRPRSSRKCLVTTNISGIYVTCVRLISSIGCLSPSFSTTSRSSQTLTTIYRPSLKAIPGCHSRQQGNLSSSLLSLSKGGTSSKAFSILSSRRHTQAIIVDGPLCKATIRKH